MSSVYYTQVALHSFTHPEKQLNVCTTCVQQV